MKSLMIKDLKVTKALSGEDLAAVRGGIALAMEIPYVPGSSNDVTKQYPGMSEAISALVPANSFPRYIDIPPPVSYSPEHGGLISPQ